MKTLIFFLLVVPYFSISQNVVKVSNIQEGIKLNDSYSFVDMLPEFVGGDDSLVKFINENMKFPNCDMESSIEGVVYVRFIVEKTGELSHIKVLKGINEEFDKEAIRIVKSMPKWKPGKQAGEYVRVYFDLPINFKNKE